MKRYLILACMLMVLLGGCSRPEPVWETVDDEIVQPVSAAEAPMEIVQPVSAAEAPMEIVFDVPEEAELLGEADCWRAYAHPDGDYAIAARTIAAGDLDEAVYAVSGYSANELRAVLRDQAGRCSFGWYAPEEDGGRLYRAEILSDHDYYYALVFDVREDAGTAYHSTEQQVFASFGLISQ